jgi:hypothetical protein
MVEFHHKKTFGYIINIYLIFFKKRMKFMMISKIELKFFQIFMCLRLNLLELLFLKLYINNKIFFSNFISQFFEKKFVVYIFP